jgi:hypothetical protein
MGTSLLLFALLHPAPVHAAPKDYDIVVYGGTPGGVAVVGTRRNLA